MNMSQLKILSLLEKHGRLTSTQIRKKLKMERTHALRDLRQIRKFGLAKYEYLDGRYYYWSVKK